MQCQAKLIELFRAVSAVPKSYVFVVSSQEKGNMAPYQWERILTKADRENLYDFKNYVIF